ncbi:MAG: LbtU family siderophore porin [Gammaproteobacteria bacterium]|nr:MAG: LbtU family siderophore porin [Gammaproteobacteria bacterium]
MAILVLPDYALAADAVMHDEVNGHVRIYRTREERREAGLKHEITDWLTLSGLLELEYEFQRFSHNDTSSHSHDDDFTKTLQIGAELHPFSWMKGELIYEYDDEANRHTLDEGFASFEAGDFELEAGRLYVPFGVYFSHFVTGPVLEFGETRDVGMNLSWAPDDRLDIAAFVYKGRARKAGSGGKDWDWGFTAEGSPFEFGSFGVSYLSDLADSQEGFLSDEGDRYDSRVDAWSAYAVVGYDRFELTAEVVRALDSFRELDPDRDRPRAWNVELGFYPAGNFEWALRVEGSGDVEDAPRLQGGVSVAWRITRTASLTLDYLRGSYRRGLAEGPGDRELDKVHQVAGQLSVEF